ncbi:MAG: alpha/beta hydrolase [Bacteroidota bacterium]
MRRLADVRTSRSAHQHISTSTRLTYSRVGEGAKVLLAFHGFGQSRMHWEELAKVLASEYTTYSFDLFYHGENLDNSPEQPLTKADWHASLQAFFAKEQINTFSVLGFSLGARFALATVEAFPDQTQALFLLAPNGISPNIWYATATHNSWTRWIFKAIVYHPKAFGLLAVVATALRLVHPKLIRFAQSQMDSSEKQHRLYQSWVNFRLLQFDMASMAALLNQKQVYTEVFLGKYDRILAEKDVQSLLKRLAKPRLTILESGHGQLIEQLIRYIKSNRHGVLEQEDFPDKQE